MPAAFCGRPAPAVADPGIVDLMEQGGVVVKRAVRTVLVLDDDERVARSMARVIGAARTVFTATTPEAGLAIARQRRPDLAIIDLRLGFTSGIEVVRGLRAELPAMHIALISGYLSTDITVAAVKAGADTVMSKPITGKELLRRVTGDTGLTTETPSLDQVEQEHIARVLADCDGNISEAARRLGIYRSSLQRKLRKRAPRASS
jgi:two-component system, response regulator RegA